MTEDYRQEKEDEFEAEVSAVLTMYLDIYLDRMGQDEDLWRALDQVTRDEDITMNVATHFSEVVLKKAKEMNYQFWKVQP